MIAITGPNLGDRRPDQFGEPGAGDDRAFHDIG
jgi:hypothetical protein